MSTYSEKNTRSTIEVRTFVIFFVVFLIDCVHGGMICDARTASAEYMWKLPWKCIEWASYAALIAIWYYLRSRKGTKKPFAKMPFSKTCNIDAQPKCTGNLASATYSQKQALIEQAAQIGDAALAKKLFQDLVQSGYQGHQKDAFIPTIVMNAFAKKGDLAGAECWLSEMKSKGMARDVVTYNILLDTCAKSKTPELCGKWVSKMTEDGVSPDAVTYSTLIGAHARQGNTEKPEMLFNHMKAVGISPDAVSFSSMIHACGVRGDFNGMARWFDEMTQAGLQPNAKTFTVAIDAYAKKGKIEEAENWMKRLIAAGLQPNVVSFSSLMDACAKIGKPERAGFWYDEMLKAGVKPNAYTFSAAITACAKVGDIDAAEVWLARCQHATVETAMIYSGVIDACAKGNDADRAWRVFEQMRARGIRPNIVTYATLARPFGQRGDYQKVEEIRHMLEGEGLAVNQYFLYAQLIAYAMARPRQEAKAQDAFKKAVAQGMQINDHISDALRRAVGKDHAIALHKRADITRRDSRESVASAAA